MPNIPGAYLAGQTIPGVVDGTVVEGATFIAYGQQGQVLIYTGVPATGNLIGSWSGMAGNDSQSNDYPIGLGLQGSGDVFTVLGNSGANVVITINGGIPYLGMATGAAEEAQAGGLESQILNPGTSEVLTMYVFGPKGSTHTDQVWIGVDSQAADGSSDAGGYLAFGNSGGQHDYLTWGAPGIQVTSPITGDTNTYQTERITAPQTSTQLINTNGGAFILNTLGLGVGTYHLHGQVCYTPVATGGTAGFQFDGGSAVVSHMGIICQDLALSAPGAIGNYGDVTALGGSFVSTTLGTTTPRACIFDGTMVVTTAGSLAILAFTNATGSFDVNVGGTYMELNPIGS